MHIKFRKIILFIAAFIIICFAISNRAARSQTGMSLNLDKEIYYVGDAVRIEYTFPDDGEYAWSRHGVRYYREIRSSYSPQFVVASARFEAVVEPWPGRKPSLE